MLAEVASFNTIKRRLQSQRPHDHRLEAALPQIRARRAGQVTLQAVDFETVFFPEPMHRVFADTERGRQFGEVQWVEPSLGFLRVADRNPALQSYVLTIHCDRPLVSYSVLILHQGQQTQSLQPIERGTESDMHNSRVPPYFYAARNCRPVFDLRNRHSKDCRGSCQTILGRGIQVRTRSHERDRRGLFNFIEAPLLCQFYRLCPLTFLAPS